MSDDLRARLAVIDANDTINKAEEAVPAPALKAINTVIPQLMTAPEPPKPEAPSAPILTDEHRKIRFRSLPLQQQIAVIMEMFKKHSGTYMTFEFNRNQHEGDDITLTDTDVDSNPFEWAEETVTDEMLEMAVRDLLFTKDIMNGYEEYEGSVTLAANGAHYYDFSVLEMVQRNSGSPLSI